MRINCRFTADILKTGCGIRSDAHSDIEHFIELVERNFIKSSADVGIGKADGTFLVASVGQVDVDHCRS